MASTATRSMTELTKPPATISKEVWAQLADERRRLMADPSANPVAADLTVSTAYLFRSKPGSHRRISHTLPMRPEEATYGDEKQFRFMDRRWQVLVAEPWMKPLYPDLSRAEWADKMAEMLEELRDEIGGTRIKFSRITGRNECFLPTNNDKLATYIRRLMADGKGEFRDVYEVNPRVRLVVGDQAFPNTESGKRLALKYAEEQGIEEIKLLKE